MLKTLLGLIFMLGTAILIGCELFDSGSGQSQPAALILNGSFELWDSTGPTHWSIENPDSTIYSQSDDTPPNGGNHSLLILQHQYNPLSKLVQGVRVPSAARKVKLNLWSIFISGGSAVLVVKVNNSSVVSDTIINFFLPTEWEEYSTVLSRSVRAGDSIFVELRGNVTLFDNVEVSLLN